MPVPANRQLLAHFAQAEEDEHMHGIPNNTRAMIFCSFRECVIQVVVSWVFAVGDAAMLTSRTCSMSIRISSRPPSSLARRRASRRTTRDSNRRTKRG